MDDPRSYQPAADRLVGRVILVTGAGRGIGRALATRCADLGATVVLLGRTQRTLETLHDEILASGAPQPGIFVMDFERAGPDDYAALQDSLSAAYGRLDGLVHNAGILGDRSPIEHYDIVVWQRVLHINLTAAFILTRYCLPLLRKSDDASIVFTSSGVGRQGRAFWGAYAVSKFGIEGLSQVLADELRRQQLASGLMHGQSRSQPAPPCGPGPPIRQKILMTLPLPEQICHSRCTCSFSGPDSQGCHRAESLDCPVG